MSGLEEAGALTTVALAAGAIEADGRTVAGKAGEAGAHPAAGHRCLNCGAPLHGAFCQACGQAAHVHRSLLHLVEELVHGLFHFDAKGWRTLPLLIARPGLLTRRYIDGQRVRYVSPLALFLFTIFVLFFVASLSSGPPVAMGASQEARAELEAELAKETAAVARAEAELAAAKQSGVGVAARTEALADVRSDLSVTRMALGTVTTAASGVDVLGRGGKPSTGVLIGVDKGFGNIRWLNRGVAHALANPELTLYKLKGSAYKYSFMLVPISLPFLWLLFAFRRGPVMYDHAVFVLYSLSFMSLLFVALVGLGAIGLPAPLLVAMALLVPPVHMAAQLRGSYGLGLAATLWRTAALVLVAGIVFALFVLFVAYVVLA